MTPRELLEAVGLDRKGRKNRMRRMGDVLVAEWAATARKDGKMRSSLSAYVRAIGIRKVTHDTVVVALPHKETGSATLARMLEFGLGPGGIGSSGPYDVRRFLLRPSARSAPKMGSTGPYRNVPFKHTTAKIKNMGGNAALQAAAALGPTRVRGGSWNGPKLAEGYTQRIANVNTGLRHRTDRLAGLRRMVGTRGRTTRYITFRRASWAGQPWMHRGITAREIGEQVARRVPELWRRIS